MNLLPTSDLSLRIVNEVTDKEMPHSKIVVNGHATSTIVVGAFLEVALRWKEYVLAFVTDDIPFEDSLRIYMLNQQYRVVDSASIGMMYTTGSFTHLELKEPNTVWFQFMGDGTWRLQLLDQRELTIPVIMEPMGVHRPLRWYRHFRLRFERGSG